MPKAKIEQVVRLKFDCETCGQHNSHKVPDDLSSDLVYQTYCNRCGAANHLEIEALDKGLPNSLNPLSSPLDNGIPDNNGYPGPTKL